MNGGQYDEGCGCYAFFVLAVLALISLTYIILHWYRFVAIWFGG